MKYNPYHYYYYHNIRTFTAIISYQIRWIISRIRTTILLPLLQQPMRFSYYHHHHTKQSRSSTSSSIILRCCYYSSIVVLLMFCCIISTITVIQQQQQEQMLHLIPSSTTTTMMTSSTLLVSLIKNHYYYYHNNNSNNNDDHHTHLTTSSSSSSSSSLLRKRHTRMMMIDQNRDPNKDDRNNMNQNNNKDNDRYNSDIILRDTTTSTTDTDTDTMMKEGDREEEEEEGTYDKRENKEEERKSDVNHYHHNNKKRDGDDDDDDTVIVMMSDNVIPVNDDYYTTNSNNDNMIDHTDDTTTTDSTTTTTIYNTFYDWEIDFIRNNDNIQQIVFYNNLSLIQLKLDLSELRRDISKIEPYSGIYGIFCTIDYTIYKQNPNLYPMYNDLIYHSPNCNNNNHNHNTQSASTMIQNNIDIRKLTNILRKYDVLSMEEKQKLYNLCIVSSQSGLGSKSSSISSSVVPIINVLNISTMIFHESRCGSTLLTNIITNINPDQYRVYSEPYPLLQAIMLICGEDYSICSPSIAANILQDTIYIMSRSNIITETNVIYKFPSIATWNIPTYQLAFPNIPYIFLYRNPIEVIVSHLYPKVPDSSTVRLLHTNTNNQNLNINETDTSSSSSSSLTIKCLSQRHSPSMNVVQIVQKYNHHHNHNDNTTRTKILAKYLPDIEYCAAHIGSITEKMISSITDQVLLINYNTIPSIIYTTILPQIFHIYNSTNTNTSNILQERINYMSSLYSKNRNHQMMNNNNNSTNQNNNNTMFINDIQRKHQLVSPEIQNAVTKYLLLSYNRLEEIRLQQVKK